MSLLGAILFRGDSNCKERLQFQVMKVLYLSASIIRFLFYSNCIFCIYMYIR